MPNDVSSGALLGMDLAVGDATVMEGAIIQPFFHIRDDVTVGPESSIGHDSTVGARCFLVFRANLADEVIAEPCGVLGADSTIRDGVTTARECVTGAGAGTHGGTAAQVVHINRAAELMMLPSDELPRI